MSFVSKLWNVIRNPIRYAGRDLEGNKYFESASAHLGGRTKRTVQYYEPDNMHLYIGGGKRLPIQWSAWLAHTRQHAPSIQELEADEIRRQTVLANAARIEERDRAEAEQMLRLRKQDTHLAIEEAASRTQSLADAAHEPLSQNPRLNLASATPEVDTTSSTNANIQPPTFLTPAAPRKPKSTKPFSLPSFDTSLPETEQIPSLSAKADTDSKPGEAFPWQPSTETESWTPKARTRR